MEGDPEILESNSTGLQLIQANIERENKEQVNFRFVKFHEISFQRPEIAFRCVLIPNPPFGILGCEKSG